MAAPGHMNNSILVIGSMPPPIHGQALATTHIVNLLIASGAEVSVLDTGSGRPGVFKDPRRMYRMLAAAWAIAALHPRHVYIGVNSGWNMALVILLCGVARAIGCAITLHHHSARYISARSTIMRTIVHAAGPEALHLTQSQAFADRFAAIYSAPNVLAYSNVGSVPPAGLRPADRPRLVLGHLGNLFAAKGVAILPDILREALANGRDAELLVAGPCLDPAARRMVETARQEFGDRFRYLACVKAARRRTSLARSMSSSSRATTRMRLRAS